MDAHAQYEIRQYANAVGELVKELWPRTWALFDEYTLGAVSLSKTEAAALRGIMHGHTISPTLHGLPESRVDEFVGKLRG